MIHCQFTEWSIGYSVDILCLYTAHNKRKLGNHWLCAHPLSAVTYWFFESPGISTNHSPSPIWWYWMLVFASCDWSLSVLFAFRRNLWFLLLFAVWYRRLQCGLIGFQNVSVVASSSSNHSHSMGSIVWTWSNLKYVVQLAIVIVAVYFDWNLLLFAWVRHDKDWTWCFPKISSNAT